MAFPVDNIRVLCAMRNTSLAELERELKIGNGVIARWETNRKAPPYDRLVAIAEYLGTTVELLSKPDISAMELTKEILDSKVTTETKKAPTDNGERNDGRISMLVSLFERLSPEDQNDVIFDLLQKAHSQLDQDDQK